MEFFRTYKKQIYRLLVIILVLLAFVTVGKKTNATIFDNAIGVVVTPVQDAVSSITGWFGKAVSSVRNETDLRKENEELKATIALLTQDIDRLSLYEDENKRLTELLEIKQKYADYTSTAANITAKDPGSFYDSFVIDKGTSDGLSANMALTSANGLVGHIYETGLTYSKAVSIIDSRSSVSAKNLRSLDIGIVKGDYSLMANGLCKMEYIDADADIVVGDEIVTSHLSDIYPEGLTIGFVKEVYTDTNGLTKYAVIEPAVDLKHLDTLLVILEEAEVDK
ncbi:MAG: rod shape-determining protein MreC [Lachnospiraceae bacterium]|nr:rod shape-determining protein MreC [Lachnospiraceae bacterium]